MNTPTSRNRLRSLLGVALLLCVGSNLSALPSTGATNLQTTNGVTFAQSGNTLEFNTPDRAVLNWNTFGSGTDTIGLLETVRYTLPTAGSSVLNIVANGTTSINGSIESNGGVYILNPNGIVIGNGARINTANLYLSTVDNAFSAAFKFAADGTLPSQDGNRTVAGGLVTIGQNAILATPNIVVLTKDFTAGAALINGNLNVRANGAVILGTTGNTAYVSGDLTVTNPTGTTTLGQTSGAVGANGSITVTTDSGTITNGATATVNTRRLNLNSTAGTINVASVAAPVVTVTGNGAVVGFSTGVQNATVNATVTGDLTVTASNALNVGDVRNTGTGNVSITAGTALTLTGLHLDSTGSASFTGSSVTDAAKDLFVYGATNFAATGTDVAITQTGHSFGPLGVTAAGNAVVYENAAINLAGVNARNLTLKTTEFFTQAAATLTATKVNLTAIGDVTFMGANILNGLTIDTKGNVDLSRLNLATSLNNVVPVVTAIGTISNPVTPNP